MVGDGQYVNLLKLYLIVRKRGGYDAVSENGLWDVVAVESGLDLGIGSSVKLVYVKYLNVLERWLERLLKCKENGPKVGELLVQLESGSKHIVSDFLDLKILRPIVNSVSVEFHASGAETVGKVSGDAAEKLDMDLADGDGVRPHLGRSCGTGNPDGDDVVELDVDAARKLFSSCRKRKRPSMWRLLKWIKGIARNPCDPVVESLPDKSKWQFYGNEELWKQSLLVRDAFFLKRADDSSTGHSDLPKNAKWHSFLYKDECGPSYNLRERQKCCEKIESQKTTTEPQAGGGGSQPCVFKNHHCEWGSCTKAVAAGCSANVSSMLNFPPKQCIPLGPDFQANVPEWTGGVYESDSKWMGTRVWPLGEGNCRHLIEREPIGKGRQTCCGCQVPNSVECVRFHTAERRSRVKLELGAAFRQWRFDRMGEEVRFHWTEKEEKQFKDAVRLNPPSRSRDRCFWDEVYKAFPNKTKENLVNYYYNVFLLQCRADQNRFVPNKTDSDDDETECGFVSKGSANGVPLSPCSLLSSAKKKPVRSKA